MRKFKIPNMSALLAFEAAARHESFTHAAKELFLTESAISRQIATLESNLGVRLFVRSKQRVMLTRAGRLYGTQVRRALENLDRDTLSIIAHGSGGGYLELAVLPTFASQWLIPRMKDFNDRNPDVRINMGIRTDLFSFEESHFEAAIHYGKPTWPGTSSDYLFGEEVVPVCAPSLLAKRIRKPHELLNYPLLHSTTRPDAWSRWFANLGVEDNATMQGVRYELHSMLISAAAAGLGIALVPKFFVDEQLTQLGLVIPFAATAVEESAYYLVYPTELSHGKPLELFRTWLLEEAAAYNAQSR
ncbi:LysR family glycine cleavage system transcriptional activator [Burkholderia sp. OAS925]|jgi:LysR family transcriptional regulator, glycine cleavage system transcriptional activator|uniref:Transcriptional regulator, LysR family n=1 Tax=Paraburkholderia graminis (strain ATCC 700544 / DSM 17151 / LMG 18924 / NCIMB 13744 / C4D1M) TaxID=396598 RepID=B1FVJ6_PARG4|nr:LysR family transcriptional regulator [Paraburkholderia graminis]ALE57740.1 LysR family transcriptional regulator [Burkholderia sp. HB1]EDT12568.1 transcriptional regulator, LysR family [Paraburkholderia graminis C4D1M]MDR6478782.1 DNA-binding transcriptional LysR family regulator [Paraburkholderia graminis]CAB3735787.1 Glycine cleavage system transcriptional activator [Paraburkholderia graminis C4D1M]